MLSGALCPNSSSTYSEVAYTYPGTGSKMIVVLFRLNYLPGKDGYRTGPGLWPTSGSQKRAGISFIPRISDEGLK